MNQSELKADRDRRADRQSEDEVRQLKDAGCIAFIVDREIDTYASKDGKIWLCDNKFSDNDIFYIDSSDIAKGLDYRIELAKSLLFKVEVGFRVDMWFPRYKSHNRRYIIFTEQDRGWSMKVNRLSTGRIQTLRVKRGGNNEQ